jgi:hypothetical protein
MSRDLLNFGVIDDGGRLGVPEIGQDLSLVEGDAGGGKDAGNFGFDGKGYNHRDAGGVGGDGVVDGGLGVDGEKIVELPM